MITRKHCVLTIALLSTGAAGLDPVAAQQTGPLVSTAWLNDQLNDNGLVILHVGNESSYAAGHIPGARLMPLALFAPARDGLSTELPEPAALQKVLEDAGIRPDSRIVIYGTSQPQTLATRLWVTLRHFGLGDNAAILDGGLRAWQAEQRPLSSQTPHVLPGSVRLQPRTDVFVDHTWIEQRLDDNSVRIADARAEPFWSGAERNQARATRAGRIPGARNIPFSSLVDDAGRLLDTAALRTLFDRAGVTAGQPIVTYCHVGQQATLLFFAAHLLGHDVKLYDGSYEDWSKRPHLRVETSVR